MKSFERNQGTALIAALLIVALMASLATSLTDLTRVSLSRTGYVFDRNQAYWYARGALEFTGNILLNSGRGERSAMASDETWLKGPHVVPIPNGQILGDIHDGNNCININAFVPNADKVENDNQREANQKETYLHTIFVTLLGELGLPKQDANNIKSQIIDWIDSNYSPEMGGAEDGHYAQYVPSYRSANQRFFEIEELLTLPSITPDIYARLRPWLCVLPISTQPPINLNTLSNDQALLLSSVFLGELTLSESESILFQRSPKGYATLDEFWQDPIITQLESKENARKFVTLMTSWFEMRVRVSLNETYFEVSQQVELKNGDSLTPHYTQFGTF